MDERYRGEQTFEDLPLSLPRTVSPKEEDAFRRLVLLDLSGARNSLQQLVQEALACAPGSAEVSYLFYDILSRVDRVVCEHRGLPQRSVRERLELVHRLSCARSTGELTGIFWSTYEGLTATLGALPRDGHPAVEQVRRFIEGNFTRKITLAEISRAVGISRNYLSHLFKQQSGVTLTEYIHRMRMKEAERLLVSGGRTVSEIAYLVGYQNYRDFHRNFAKYRKISPKKFRQFRGVSRRRSRSLPLEG
ncbi:MAG: helix-turn-helix transcriptional regulator, partial [Planctomycetota bacterium]